MVVLMRTYDESSIVRRLSQLDRTRKTAFAAACAQRLSPLYLRYAEAVPGVDSATIRSVVGLVWEVLSGAQVDLRPQQHVAEGQVPPEDDNWVLETGYAQNAAACAAYAVRAWLTDDAQEAAWAARQAYEVSDHAAQQLLADLDLNAPEAESRLAGHELVQAALDSIERDLRVVEDPELDLDTLAARATNEGIAWSRGMP
jgi:uncharacterized protein YjaG (DUF416 family)